MKKHQIVVNCVSGEVCDVGEKIIQANLSRNDFTHHGLHLNISGKKRMAN